GQLDSQLGSQLGSQLYTSVWWRVWSGWYEGASLLGVVFDAEKQAAFRDWNSCCPVVCGSQAIVIVARNPTTVSWSEGMLSDDNGPSVQWSDGTALWTIGGVPVDEQIVMRPGTQTVEEIDAEENGDVRSIRIERFGWPRYLRECGAVMIDSRHNDISNQQEALFRTPAGDQRLVVTCPTRRMFALGVPGDVKTCEQSQNWLAGDKPFRELART
ncbi:MAG: DUF6745 domain-containing protein, partial [Nannocystaceae bacterium]